MSSVWSWTKFLCRYFVWSISGAQVISDGKAGRAYDDPDRPPWMRHGWTDLLYLATGNVGGFVSVAAGTVFINTNGAVFYNDKLEVIRKFRVEVRPSNLYVVGSIRINLTLYRGGGEELITKSIIVDVPGQGFGSATYTEEIGLNCMVHAFKIVSIQSNVSTDVDVSVATDGVLIIQ